MCAHTQLKYQRLYTAYTYTVEPLYCRHHWDPSNCPMSLVQG